MFTWIIIATILSGFALVWIEFYLPGGVVGAAGVIAILVGLGMFFAEHSLWVSTLVSIVVMSLLLLMIRYWMRTLHRSFLGRRIMLRAEVGGTEMYESAATMVGRTGVTLSRLNPSGKARIDGERHDVMSEMGMIEAGVTVKVVRVDAGTLIVRA